MNTTSAVFGILWVLSLAARASAQESRGDAGANRLGSPIDFWGKGPPRETGISGAAEAPQAGPGKIMLRETVWAQPIRTPDGTWMLYVPPKPILDFLENPSEATAKAYLAWKKEQAEKLSRAMLLLGRLKEPGSGTEQTQSSGAKAGEGRQVQIGSTNLIYFKKPSCPHCTSQDAILGQWLPKHPELQAQILHPSEQPDLWRAYSVRGTPTLVLRTASGKEEVLVGLQSETQLEAALARSALPSPARPEEREASR